MGDRLVNHVLQAFPSLLRLGKVNVRRRVVCRRIEGKITKNFGGFSDIKSLRKQEGRVTQRIHEKQIYKIVDFRVYTGRH